MLRSLPFAFAVGIFILQAHAQENAKLMIATLPEEFTSESSKVNDTTLHYVGGGKGPPVILIHGFPEDWYEWHAIMP